jgi:hypothetical protein
VPNANRKTLIGLQENAGFVFHIACNSIVVHQMVWSCYHIAYAACYQ